jgi:hypothetical protein
MVERGARVRGPGLEDVVRVRDRPAVREGQQLVLGHRPEHLHARPAARQHRIQSHCRFTKKKKQQKKGHRISE